MSAKSLLISSIAATCMLCLAGCTHDPFKDTEVDNEELIDPKHRELLTSWGYNGNDMTVFEDGYAVEGDVFVKKEYLESIIDSTAQTRQTYYGSDHLIFRENYRIHVDYSQFKGDWVWVDAFLSAMGEWTAVAGCVIEFTNITNNHSGATTVYLKELYESPERIGMSSMPANGKAGDVIWINSDSSIAKDYSYSEMKMIAVHLLGHNMGLSHTGSEGFVDVNNPIFRDQNGPIEGERIDGTPEVDSRSVMRYDIYSKDFIGLSDYDRLAIRYLYPVIDMSEFSIDGPNEIKKGTPTNYSVMRNTSVYSNINWDISLKEYEATIDASYYGVTVTIHSTIQKKATISAYVMYQGTSMGILTKEVNITDVIYDDISLKGPDIIPQYEEGLYELDNVDSDLLESVTWSCTPESAGRFIQQSHEGNGARLETIEMGEITVTATVKYKGYNENDFTKQITVIGPMVDLSNVQISGPESTFKGNTENYKLLGVPEEGVRYIEWKFLRNDRGLVSGTPPPVIVGSNPSKTSVDINFPTREIVTIQAKIVPESDRGTTKVVTQEVVIEGNLDARKLRFTFHNDRTGETYIHYPFDPNFEVGINEELTWMVGDQGTCIVSGHENLDLSLTTGMRWGDPWNKSVTIHDFDDYSADIEITRGYFVPGNLVYVDNYYYASLEYTIKYKSVRGWNIEAYNTIELPIRVDNSVPYITHEWREAYNNMSGYYAIAAHGVETYPHYFWHVSEYPGNSPTDAYRIIDPESIPAINHRSFLFFEPLKSGWYTVDVSRPIDLDSTEFVPAGIGGSVDANRNRKVITEVRFYVQLTE